MISPLKGRKTINRNSTVLRQQWKYEHIRVKTQPTIDIHYASTVSDQAVGSRQDIVDADTKTDFLYDLQMSVRQSLQKYSICNFTEYLICIFRINVVFDSLPTRLMEVFRRYLDQVRDGCLQA